MSPFSLALTAALIFGVSPVLIFFLTRFAQRTIIAGTAVPHHLAWITPVALAGWYVSANIVGYFIGKTNGGLLSPASLFQVFVPLSAAILIMFLARPVTLLLERMPADWLIRIQGYRIGGFLFLYLYFHDNFLSRGFALAAGVGDFVVGFSAFFISQWVRTKE